MSMPDEPKRIFFDRPLGSKTTPSFEQRVEAARPQPAPPDPEIVKMVELNKRLFYDGVPCEEIFPGTSYDVAEFLKFMADRGNPGIVDVRGVWGDPPMRPAAGYLVGIMTGRITSTYPPRTDLSYSHSYPLYVVGDGNIRADRLVPWHDHKDAVSSTGYHRRLSGLISVVGEWSHDSHDGVDVFDGNRYDFTNLPLEEVLPQVAAANTTR